jgi:menaquinol-cytochrome c reductase cytochrome b/c subunit
MAIAFEPTIVGCSAAPTKCTSANAVKLRESREARSHRCPADKPYVLIKPGGALVCVTSLSSTGSPRRGVLVPQVVQARGPTPSPPLGPEKSFSFEVAALPCHRLGEAGNRGPGSNLTHVGSRLSSAAINRALVDTRAPMPAFSGLPRSERRNLVYFLSQLG